MRHNLKFIRQLENSFLAIVLILPIAAIAIAVGEVTDNPFLSGFGNQIYSILPFLYAMGITRGFAKDKNNIAVFSAAVGYLLFEAGYKAVLDTTDLYILGGLIAGSITVFVYRFFDRIKFSGIFEVYGNSRSIPIANAIILYLFGGLMGHVWPYLERIISGAGQWIGNNGIIGTFVYGTLNRLLLPFGLHHNLNAYLWYKYGEFNGIHGDMYRYFAGDPTAGTYMTGFYLVMMFGLPAVMFAFYRTISRPNRRFVIGLYLSGAIISFLTGITEPIELLFMFLIPELYLFHAILTGVALVVADMMHVSIGFEFSAGFIDFVRFVANGEDALKMAFAGAIFAGIYFFSFRYIIKRYINLVPGDYVESENRQREIADMYVETLKENLGGTDNIRYIMVKYTRFEINVINSEAVEKQLVSQMSNLNFIKINDNTYQVITGNQGKYLKESIINAFGDKVL